jgi:hypothetical protein
VCLRCAASFGGGGHRAPAGTARRASAASSDRLTLHQRRLAATRDRHGRRHRAGQTRGAGSRSRRLTTNLRPRLPTAWRPPAKRDRDGPAAAHALHVSHGQHPGCLIAREKSHRRGHDTPHKAPSGEQVAHCARASVAVVQDAVRAPPAFAWRDPPLVRRDRMIDSSGRWAHLDTVRSSSITRVPATTSPTGPRPVNVRDQILVGGQIAVQSQVSAARLASAVTAGPTSR